MLIKSKKLKSLGCFPLSVPKAWMQWTLGRQPICPIVLNFKNWHSLTILVLFFWIKWMNTDIKYTTHVSKVHGHADAGKDFLVVRPKPSWQGARPFLGYTCNTIINEFGGKPTGWGFRSTGSGSSNNQFVLWNEAAEFCAPISQESTIACNIAEHSNSPSLNVGKSL